MPYYPPGTVLIGGPLTSAMVSSALGYQPASPSGSIAGSASLNVLKSGDTMTGPLTGTAAKFTSVLSGTVGNFTSLTIDGVPVGGGNYLPLTGGTLSGELTGTVISGTRGVFTAVTGTSVTGTTALFTMVTGTVVTGSTALFTVVTGTTVTGSTALFVMITGTTVTGSTALFTTLNGYSTSITTANSTIVVRDANGNISGTDLVATSDARLKSSVQNIRGALATVSYLQGVTFVRKGDDQARKMGVIAQEVEAYVPEVIGEGADGYKNVSYNGLVGLLIEAVKELSARVERLEADRDG